MREITTKADLALALDSFQSRLTVRLGGMIAAGVVALAILHHFH